MTVLSEWIQHQPICSRPRSTHVRTNPILLLNKDINNMPPKAIWISLPSIDHEDFNSFCSCIYIFIIVYDMYETVGGGCVCAQACTHTCRFGFGSYDERYKDNIGSLLLSCGSGYRTQVIRLGGKPLFIKWVASLRTQIKSAQAEGKNSAVFGLLLKRIFFPNWKKKIFQYKGSQ